MGGGCDKTTCIYCATARQLSSYLPLATVPLVIPFSHWLDNPADCFGERFSCFETDHDTMRRPSTHDRIVGLAHTSLSQGYQIWMMTPFVGIGPSSQGEAYVKKGRKLSVSAL